MPVSESNCSDETLSFYRQVPERHLVYYLKDSFNENQIHTIVHSKDVPGAFFIWGLYWNYMTNVTRGYEVYDPISTLFMCLGCKDYISIEMINKIKVSTVVCAPKVYLNTISI